MTKKRDSVYVSSTDLPWYMKEGLFIERKSRHLYQIPNETFIFTSDEGWSNHKIENEKQSSIYDYIDYKYEELQARGIEEEELELLIENDIQSFFVQYFNQMSKRQVMKMFLKLWIVISFPFVKELQNWLKNIYLRRLMKSISRFKFTCTDNSTTFTSWKTNSSPTIKSNSYEI